MAKYGKTGVTSATPDKILFGAGTIHKNLKYTSNAWNFSSSIVGATSGGSKFSIKPEITDVSVDGALVATKGLRVKTGETATMEINFVELTKDVIMAGTLGAEGTSNDESFVTIESKAAIADSDYWENIAFVGKTVSGKNVIVIMDNALCTSGMEAEGKDKEGSVTAYTFECHADITSDLDTLPWHIYWPDAEA